MMEDRITVFISTFIFIMLWVFLTLLNYIAWRLYALAYKKDPNTVHFSSCMTYQVAVLLIVILFSAGATIFVTQ